MVGFLALTPDEQAAWVQAMLSGIGILIAAWVPFKIHQGEVRRNAEREAADHEREMLKQQIADFRAAVALAPVLGEVMVEAQSILEKVQQYSAASAPPDDVRKLIVLPLLHRATDWMQRHSQDASPALEADLLAAAVWASRLEAVLEAGVHTAPNTVTPTAYLRFDDQELLDIQRFSEFTYARATLASLRCNVILANPPKYPKWQDGIEIVIPRDLRKYLRGDVADEDEEE